ncbi:MAG TPA: beta-phosphoglucomutase family hydrolase [Candidatus Xenobia bacterium]|jgi:alpha,alpha-trehalase
MKKRIVLASDNAAPMARALGAQLSLPVETDDAVSAAVDPDTAVLVVPADRAGPALSVATQPVLAVPPEVSPPTTLSRLLCPIDGRRKTSFSLEPAVSLAHRLGASIDLLYVSGPAPPPEKGRIEAPRYVDQAHHDWPDWTTEVRERFQAYATSHPDIPTRVYLAHGEVHEEVERLARELGSDAIVLVHGAHFESGRAQVVRTLLKTAPCPVLVLAQASGDVHPRSKAEQPPRLDMGRYQAVLFDMDGVVTQTAELHAAAWKHVFDEYLQAQRQRPFDADLDYRLYVDGRPRYDGVKTFLASRHLELPYGSPEDPPDRDTVCGLGNKKDGYFERLFHERGVKAYDTTVALIRRVRQQGKKTGLFSASKHAGPILEAAGVLDLFDARVDGVDAARLHLPGKPDPAMILELARRLGVAASACVVVEDAVAGVEAGHAGHFALVVGINRRGRAGDLLQQGADLEVHDLRELLLT